MATIFDTSLLASFDVVFTAVLVFGVVFALLRKTKALGDSAAIDAVIAVAASLLVIISDVAVNIINFMAPWFVVVFLFVMLLLLIYQIFGVGENDIASYLKGDKGLGWLIFAIGLVIFVAALGNTLGQETLELTQGKSNTVKIIKDVNGTTTSVSSTDFEKNIFTTLFHPKMLGLMVILFVMIFAIGLLTGPAKG